MRSQDGYVMVAQALISAVEAKPVPRGVRCSMYSAIDNLRLAPAEPEHLDIAEKIATTVHRLEWAHFNGDAERQAELLLLLNRYADEWAAIREGLDLVQLAA